MEEADIRMNEIRKAGYDFEKTVLRGGRNEHTGKVIAEKIEHYIEDLLKAKVLPSSQLLEFTLSF